MLDHTGNSAKPRARDIGDFNGHAVVITMGFVFIAIRSPRLAALFGLAALILSLRGMQPMDWISGAQTR